MGCKKFKKFKDCHDPDANLPYSFTWNLWLTEETAVLVDDVDNRSITITPDDVSGDTTPLVIGAIITDVDNGIIYVWLSGGTAGIKYNITCRITTDTGLTEDQTGILTCSEK